MNLPKSQFTKNASKETYVAAGLIAIAGFFLILAIVHHGRAKGIVETMAQAKAPRRGLALVNANNNKGLANKILTALQRRSEYHIHLKTMNLDAYSSDKRFPAVAVLYVDGQQVAHLKNPHFFNKALTLKAGKHVVAIKMWNAKNVLTQKQYTIFVGVPAMGMKVAKR